MPTPEPVKWALSPDAKVALAGALNAVLMTLGMSLQKLNGVRGGHALWSGWLLLSLLCFAPTFPIANRVYLAGGRMSVFVPAGALTYVLSLVVARALFREAVSPAQWAGCALILAGVAVVARG